MLLLGGSGQVGAELRGLLPAFCQLVSPGRAEAPLDDLMALRRAVREARPQAIVNAAAWNDVDGAEHDPAGALRVNRDAVALLGEEAKALGAPLIHYSTDYVFDGHHDAPYQEDHPASPLSAYGRSKRAGEEALLQLDAPAVILRTAWVYSLARKSFVSAILAAARQRSELRVVDDQVGHPTFARDLAAVTALLLRGAGPQPLEALQAARGVYHAAGGGACSRYQLARAAIDLDPRAHEHTVLRVVPVPSSAFPLPARRPRAVILDGSKLRQRFGLELPPWREALARALSDSARNGAQ